jgi:hypothetical protein
LRRIKPPAGGAPDRRLRVRAALRYIGGAMTRFASFFSYFFGFFRPLAERVERRA